MVIRYYSGTMLFVYLYGGKDLDRILGEGVMPVSISQLQCYAVRITNDVKDRIERIHHDWIVAIWFNPLHSINFPLNLEGYSTLQRLEDLKRRKPKVECLHKMFPGIS